MTDAGRGVVLAAMAGAEPAAPIAARVARLVAQRNAAEMGADADGDEPLLLAGLDARCVGGRVDQVLERGGLGLLDLVRGAVAEEDRLALPDRGDALALLDRARSTSMLDSASTSLAGAMLSTRGHASETAPMPAAAPVSSFRKSRFVGSALPTVVIASRTLAWSMSDMDSLYTDPGLRHVPGHSRCHGS